MTKILHCAVPATASSYKIVIQRGLLTQEQLKQWLNKVSAAGKQLAIVSDTTIAALYGEKLLAANSSPPTPLLLTIPCGETSKSRRVKEELEDQLFAAGLGRDSCVIACGGGIVTDLAGFVAATYCRGIDLVLIPTSLLAMVDAAIGGKTGVNVPQGKNLVGAIYPPKAVLIDVNFLTTLPLRELKNGIVEMIKHAAIADSDFFAFLEIQAKELLQVNLDVLEQAIYQSCCIKKKLVEMDEKEQGPRRLLNFGHTIGHAIETVTNYAIAHGEAVALGMLVEGHMAQQLGQLSQSDFERLCHILQAYALPMLWPTACSFEALSKAMALDKKALKKQSRFVIIDKIGSAKEYEGNYCTCVDEPLIQNAICAIRAQLYQQNN